MSQFAAYSLVGGLFVFGAALAHAVSKLRSRRDRFLALESTYATVPAHLVEFLFWTVRHSWASLANPDERRERVRRALFAGALFVAVLAMPVVAIAAADSGSLADHAVVVGAGALIWTCMLETATLRERIMRLTGRELIRTRRWVWALVLFCLDFLLVIGWLAIAHTHGMAWLKFGSAGASFVAIADLISCLVGICLTTFDPYPLCEA